jgi:Secretion system C-terminal sorting domain/Receptor L domain
MFKKFYILSLFCLLATLSQRASAQTFTGDLTLSSQEEVDAFNYTQVTGNLRIEPISSDIYDLNGLSELTTVGGTLTIGYTNTVDLTGLSALTSVGGLIINLNPFLTDLTALSALNSVGVGGLLIDENLELTTLALPALTSVLEWINIDNNNALTSLDLSELTSVGKGLGIAYTYLTSLALPLPALTSVGDLFIGRNPSLTSLGLPSLTSVQGILSVGFNATLTSLTGLDNITPGTITELRINSNPLLSTCEVQSICSYLAVPANSATISGNATNCASRAAVEAACATLPVEMVNFQAFLKDNKTALLVWQTVSESNNAGFDIEASQDGVHFEKIGFVKGNGTTSETKKYQYIDEKPTANLTYYRLKQIDIDGGFEYSKIVSVLRKSDKFNAISVSPNPANGVLNIVVETQNDNDLAINLLDIFGKTIKQQTTTTQQGLNNKSLDLQDLPNGIYFLQLQQGTERIVRKVVKE